METTCTYCQLDSAGNHNGNCPAKNVVNPIVNTSTNTISPMTKEQAIKMEQIIEELKNDLKLLNTNIDISYHSGINDGMYHLYRKLIERGCISQPKTEPSRTCICVESARKEIGWYQETLCNDCHKPLDKNSQKQTP